LCRLVKAFTILKKGPTKYDRCYGIFRHVNDNKIKKCWTIFNLHSYIFLYAACLNVESSSWSLGSVTVNEPRLILSNKLLGL
jgi:hypothetical protein